MSRHDAQQADRLAEENKQLRAALKDATELLDIVLTEIRCALMSLESLTSAVGEAQRAHALIRERMVEWKKLVGE